MVKIGNFYYFMYIGIFILLMFTLYFILRRYDKEKQYKILLGIAFANLILHFSKLLFKPYFNELPGSIRSITFCNICAVSTLIMPWIYLYKKNKYLNNYIYFIGVIGGLGALFYPTEAINENPFCFDTIRFYLCHMSLVGVPILMAIFKIFQPDYKKAFTIPIFFLIIEIIIFLNEIFLVKVGLVGSTWVEFFDREIRNTSFVFGPTYVFDKIAPILLVFVPKLFRTNIFGIIGGIDFYWPVIWMIIPAFIYLPIISTILELPFEYKNIKNDIIKWKKNKC